MRSILTGFIFIHLRTNGRIKNGTNGTNKTPMKYAIRILKAEVHSEEEYLKGVREAMELPSAKHAMDLYQKNVKCALDRITDLKSALKKLNKK